MATSLLVQLAQVGYSYASRLTPTELALEGCRDLAYSGASH
jgi:hypothetical protein